MKKQALLSIVTFALLCFVSSTDVLSQTTCTPVYTTPGSFDTCFGYDGTGKVITNVPNTSRAFYPGSAALQSDGKILSLIEAPFEPQEGNNFNTVIIRYNADGTIDTSFASGGVLYIDWRMGSNNTTAYDLAVQLVNSFDANGNPIVEDRIVVIGAAPPLVSGERHRLKVERYLPNGLKDYTFGTDGTGTVVVNAAYGLTVTIQPQDQKILTVGDLGVLVRLNANGTPDVTFGVNGVSQVNAGSSRGIAVQPDGKILTAAGSITRYNANGTLDTTFGKSGRTANNILASRDVKILANGYILAGGSVSANRKNNMAVARFTPNGQLDTTFGGGTGKATISVSPNNDTAHNIDLQSNGKIVLFGDADGVNGYRDFGVARFNANGTIDTTFGQSGKVTWDYLGANDEARGLVQRNVCGAGCDRIVAVGPARTSLTNGFGTSLAAAIGYIP
jgi:uncharacterized delta-60 repeat protein